MSTLVSSGFIATLIMAFIGFDDPRDQWVTNDILLGKAHNTDALDILEIAQRLTEPFRPLGQIALRNIARDDHAGWSGIEKRFHIYTLNVSDGGSGVFTLRVRMRAADGGDPTGVVYFRR